MPLLTWSRYPASDSQCQSLPGAMVQKEPGLSHTVVAAVARSGLGPAHQRGHKPTPSQVRSEWWCFSNVNSSHQCRIFILYFIMFNRNFSLRPVVWCYLVVKSSRFCYKVSLVCRSPTPWAKCPATPRCPATARRRRRAPPWAAWPAWQPSPRSTGSAAASPRRHG